MADTFDIDVQNFRTWLKDPVTMAMMDMLKEYREFLEFCMLSPDEILREGGQIKYAQYVGSLECVDRMLNLQVDDLVRASDEESSGREQMDPSGIQD